MTRQINHVIPFQGSSTPDILKFASLKGEGTDSSEDDGEDTGRSGEDSGVGRGGSGASSGLGGLGISYALKCVRER
jgi:hypothetical protein